MAVTTLWVVQHYEHRALRKCQILSVGETGIPVSPETIALIQLFTKRTLSIFVCTLQNKWFLLVHVQYLIKRSQKRTMNIVFWFPKHPLLWFTSENCMFIYIVTVMHYRYLLDERNWMFETRVRSIVRDDVVPWHQIRQLLKMCERFKSQFSTFSTWYQLTTPVKVVVAFCKAVLTPNWHFSQNIPFKMFLCSEQCLLCHCMFESNFFCKKWDMSQV